MITGTAALGTVGGGQIIIWLFDCIEQGHLVHPDAATAQLMAGILAPLVHGLWRAWVARGERASGTDLDGDGKVSGAPTQEPVK